jgi:hypothetical protein
MVTKFDSAFIFISSVHFKTLVSFPSCNLNAQELPFNIPHAIYHYRRGGIQMRGRVSGDAQPKATCGPTWPASSFNFIASRSNVQRVL